MVFQWILVIVFHIHFLRSTIRQKKIDKTRSYVKDFTAKKFDIIKLELQKIRFNLSEITKVDETGINNVQYKFRKIFAR